MRASSTNFHSDSGSPASISWRGAPRSGLPGRIEKSTLAEASSTGDRANQSSHPQNPRMAAEIANIRSFRRNSIDVVGLFAGSLDYARIINAKRDTVDELAP